MLTFQGVDVTCVFPSLSSTSQNRSDHNSIVATWYDIWGGEKKYLPNFKYSNTVILLIEENPTPVNREFTPVTGLYTSQLVQDFWTINSMKPKNHLDTDDLIAFQHVHEIHGMVLMP